MSKTKNKTQNELKPIVLEGDVFIAISPLFDVVRRLQNGELVVSPEIQKTKDATIKNVMSLIHGE